LKYQVIAFVIFGYFSFHISDYFVSLPKISSTVSEVVVGSPDSTGARYVKGAVKEISGTVVNYSFNSFGFGGSFIEKLGARGSISTLPPREYNQIMSTHKSTGQCLGSLLNESSVEHLELIPESQKALKQMRKASLKAGSTYRLVGRYLILKDATLDGQPLTVDMGGGTFFLVEGIKKL
jgi:hypothetical protein